MVFSSIAFLGLFLPLVFFAYQLGGAGWKNGVLLVASLLFYAWGEPRYVLLLLLSVAMNYRFGTAVYRREGASRRCMLAAAIAANLLLLGVFKYANFVIDNVNTALLAFGAGPVGHLGGKLPIGISFYTFHAISYLVDISRRNVEPNRSLTQFSLYIMLFPQLVAGPIIRYKDIWTQLGTRCASLDAVSHGVLRFVTGLSKKVLLANPLGAVADDAFGEPASGLDPANAWFGLLCYTLQIYFDFSGYSDMAIGLGRMFGFRFPENFNYPYRAASIQEFWRRWHITLSTWFRDYVYIPLGGNRRGAWHTLRNLWIVFLLAGLWHGASWNFVIWGALHGAFLTIEYFVPSTALTRSRLARYLGHAYALLAVMVAWVFFRAHDLQQALDYLLALVGYWPRESWALVGGPLYSRPLVAIVMLAAVLSWPIAPRILARCRAFLESRMLLGTTAALVTVILLAVNAMALAMGQYNPFIYFRF